MKATMIRKGRTLKIVEVSDIPFGTSNNEVVEAALAAVGETPASIFGWRIHWTPVYAGAPAIASVSIHTD